MKIEIKIKKVEELSKKAINFMNQCRNKEYGKGSTVDFKREDKGGIFFFVIDNKKVKAFGMLKPVNLEYKGKKYQIMGIGRGMAIEKLKGYGKALGLARLNYLKKKGKTGIAFTDKKNVGFFEKVGFKIKKNFIKRFRYKNPKTGEIVIDNEGEGIYYEGKDKLISSMLKNKSIAYIDVPFW
jgi:hypothetical protein